MPGTVTSQRTWGNGHQANSAIPGRPSPSMPVRLRQVLQERIPDEIRDTDGRFNHFTYTWRGYLPPSPSDVVAPRAPALRQHVLASAISGTRESAHKGLRHKLHSKANSPASSLRTAAACERRTTAHTTGAASSVAYAWRATAKRRHPQSRPRGAQGRQPRQDKSLHRPKQFGKPRPAQEDAMYTTATSCWEIAEGASRNAQALAGPGGDKTDPPRYVGEHHDTK